MITSRGIRTLHENCLVRDFYNTRLPLVPCKSESHKFSAIIHIYGLVPFLISIPRLWFFTSKLEGAKKLKFCRYARL